MLKKNSRVIKLTTPQQEHLIDLVEQHPPLYNVTLADHKNKMVTTNTWKKIAREMDVDGLGCK